MQREAIDAVVIPDRLELPRIGGISYRAFFDFAGDGAASGDAATQAIAYTETRGGRGVVILDLIREVRPPFSPEQVCAEFAATSKAYGITTATADRWAGQFPVEQMRKHGIRVEPSAKSKSDIYRDLLPIINSGSCELLDHPRLLAQLAGLERRTARGGKDSIDHAPGGHDDIINAAAGALVLAALHRIQPIQIVRVRGYGGELETRTQTIEEWRAQEEATRKRIEEQRQAILAAPATMMVVEKDSGWCHQIYSRDFDPSRHRPA